jgi:hypothetical protein
MNNIQKNQVATFIRFLLYFFSFALVIFCILRLLILSGFQILLKDNNIIEWAEFCWLALSSSFLLMAARKSIEFSNLYAILGLFPILAGIRELDAVLDQIFHGAWAVPAGALYLLIIYRIYKKIQQLKGETLRFVHTPQIVFIGIGLFTVVFLAQFLGQKIIWQALLGPHYVRIAGRFIEEILEFFGYILLLVGSIECYLTARNDSTM